jgi:hypothetical protein
MDFQPEAKQYTVSVRTNGIHEAIAETGNALYALVDEALLSHEPHELDEECEFEEFARDLLRVLASHSEQLASSGDTPDTDAWFFLLLPLGVCLSIRNSLVSTTRHCGSDQSRPQHVN